jgi:hypothetical protein
MGASSSRQLPHPAQTYVSKNIEKKMNLEKKYSSNNYICKTCGKEALIKRNYNPKSNTFVLNPDFICNCFIQ